MNTEAVIDIVRGAIVKLDDPAAPSLGCIVILKLPDGEARVYSNGGLLGEVSSPEDILVKLNTALVQALEKVKTSQVPAASFEATESHVLHAIRPGVRLPHRIAAVLGVPKDQVSMHLRNLSRAGAVYDNDGHYYQGSRQEAAKYRRRVTPVQL